eukprot:8039708-Pyramimonas_sp.AAC.1
MAKHCRDVLAHVNGISKPFIRQLGSVAYLVLRRGRYPFPFWETTRLNNVRRMGDHAIVACQLACPIIVLQEAMSFIAGVPRNGG